MQINQKTLRLPTLLTLLGVLGFYGWWYSHGGQVVEAKIIRLQTENVRRKRGNRYRTVQEYTLYTNQGRYKVAQSETSSLFTAAAQQNLVCDFDYIGTPMLFFTPEIKATPSQVRCYDQTDPVASNPPPQATDSITEIYRRYIESAKANGMEIQDASQWAVEQVKAHQNGDLQKLSQIPPDQLGDIVEEVYYGQKL
jgi:hypothetical protein